MCGITGWVSFSRDVSRERDVIDAMTETMACRGPDASGGWSDTHVTLGHRRLAVIDLPGGVQPMTVSTPRGDVVIVYSGEVYNFQELRSQLIAQGATFQTLSDTEVVLRGYLHWGQGLADRLGGMYAFAIWDSREGKLVLIRDRMGVKPLYFHPTADGVLFGSEPKAILANPLAKPALDVAGLRELFVHIKTPGHAIWKGMREVVPGTIVTVDPRGIREHSYWRLEPKQHRDDKATSVLTVRELLDDIVSRQLIADVPECILLSGGLDSSAITALSARALEDQVRTFAVDFSGDDTYFRSNIVRPTRDAPFVADVAKFVGTDHTDIVLNRDQLTDLELRRTVIRARDLPSGGGDLDASLYLLFKAIRQQSTVALSGEAADEVFGGYHWFHAPRVQESAAFPWMAMEGSVFHGLSELLSPPARQAADIETYLRDGYTDAVAEVARVDGEDVFTHRMRVMSHLHLTRFVRILLDRKDRMSMAVGLEVRVPFCDHRLVEYVYNAPWSLKTFDGREKSLLRGATRDVLPESVIQRVKSQYPSTADPKYGAELQRQVTDILGTDSDDLFGVLDRQAVQRLAQLNPEELSAQERFRLEHVLNLAVWLDMYRPEVTL
jgi:asparagine synthase (glutamine-hydrolysing)